MSNLPDLDHRVRTAAFRFLEGQTQLRGEVLPREILARGFVFYGQRVPLVGPQGIFKPALLREMQRQAPLIYTLRRRAGAVHAVLAGVGGGG